jgi:biopolymer transport protein ExbD
MGAGADRHQGSGRRPLIIGINVTPLVDVALVLLIIMMVSSTYIVSQTLKVELPKSKSSDGASTSPHILTLLRDGTIRLNGKVLEASAVDAALKDLVRSNPDPSLVISADRDSSHGQVVKLIDAAKLAGIRKFAINVEKRE